MAVARDRMGGVENVVALAGDAAFTCGITYEAVSYTHLNNHFFGTD